MLFIFICFIYQVNFAQKITEGNNKFAIKLLNRLANANANSFFSPYSISTALFMTTGGAKSQTEQQMLKVLEQPMNTPEFHNQFGQHIALVEKKEKIQLNIANSLWMQKGFKFQQAYIDLLNNAYKAKLNECNFAVNPDMEAKKINKWVESKTKSKIKDLIKPGILKPNTKMVLVNAIYFFGGWNKEFLKENTKTADFKLNNGQLVKADFMNAEYNMFYASNADFEMLSIPYEKSEATMLVFLPRSKDNFKNTLNSLNFESYNALVGQLKQHKVNVSIPKFKMTAEFELKETLSEMGMPIPFSDAADFSAMSAEDELKIDKVIHKAFIDVSEKGTEAAGATAIVITTKSAMPDKEQVIYFKADHPFIFMIKDNATGQILFAGVLNKPEKQ